MKRKMTFSLTLTLSLLLSLVSLPSTAQGQQGGRRAIRDTGMTRLGPGQILRVAASPAGNYTFAFRRMYYTRVGPDINGVVKTTLAAQDTSAPVTLAADEAASIDITQGGFDGVRVQVISRSFTGTAEPNSLVTLQIINSANGEIVAFWILDPIA